MHGAPVADANSSNAAAMSPAQCSCPPCSAMLTRQRWWRGRLRVLMLLLQGCCVQQVLPLVRSCKSWFCGADLPWLSARRSCPQYPPPASPAFNLAGPCCAGLLAAGTLGCGAPDKTRGSGLRALCRPSTAAGAADVAIGGGVTAPSAAAVTVAVAATCVLCFGASTTDPPAPPIASSEELDVTHDWQR